METLESVIYSTLKKYLGKEIPSLEKRALDNAFKNRGLNGALTALENISSKYFSFNNSSFKKVSGSKMLSPNPTSIKESLKLNRTIIIHNEKNSNFSFQLKLKGLHFYALDKKVEVSVLKEYIQHKDWNLYEISLK